MLKNCPINAPLIAVMNCLANPSVPQDAAAFLECSEKAEKESPRLRIMSIVMLSLSALVGLIFIPILLLRIKGTRRVFVVMQQITAIAYLISLLLPQYRNEVSLNFIEGADYRNFHKLFEEGGFFSKLAMVYLLRFLQYFVYYAYYLASMMQTVDIYMMVCHPFLYGEFSSLQRIATGLLKGLAVCLSIASPDLMITFAMIIFHLAGFDIINRQFLRVQHGIEIFKVVVMFVAKILYSGAIIRMGYFIRKGFKESLSMGESVCKRKCELYKRLFHFCLIPQFLNVLFLVPEIFVAVRRIAKPSDSGCSESDVFDRGDVVMGLNVCVFTFGTVLYYLGFVILFPAVRKAFACQSANDD